jgi:hypothetical protein
VFCQKRGVNKTTKEMVFHIRYTEYGVKTENNLKFLKKTATPFLTKHPIFDNSPHFLNPPFLKIPTKQQNNNKTTTKEMVFHIRYTSMV